MFKFDNGKDNPKIVFKGIPIIEQIESIPKNSNPFHYDRYHMGKELDKEYMLMFGEFEKNNYVIIIEKSTGKRIKLNLNNLFNLID